MQHMFLFFLTLAWQEVLWVYQLCMPVRMSRCYTLEPCCINQFEQMRQIVHFKPTSWIIVYWCRFIWLNCPSCGHVQNLSGCASKEFKIEWTFWIDLVWKARLRSRSQTHFWAKESELESLKSNLTLTPDFFC